MTGRSKSVAAASMTAVALLLFAPAAHAQMKKGSHAAPSVETRPRVDEKATRRRSTGFRRRRSRMIPGARSTTRISRRNPRANRTEAQGLWLRITGAAVAPVILAVLALTGRLHAGASASAPLEH